MQFEGITSTTLNILVLEGLGTFKMQNHRMVGNAK
jgi:hypothetical protein